MNCDERCEVFQGLVRSLLIPKQPQIHPHFISFLKHVEICLVSESSCAPGPGGRGGDGMGLVIGNSVPEFCENHLTSFVILLEGRVSSRARELAGADAGRATGVRGVG